MQFPTPETIWGIRMGTSCSELKVYFLLDCSDVWELGPKLVFRGSDPSLVSSTCVFSLCVVNSGSLLIMFMFRK